MYISASKGGVQKKFPIMVWELLQQSGGQGWKVAPPEINDTMRGPDTPAYGAKQRRPKLHDPGEMQISPVPEKLPSLKHEIPN
jgi:hypothetical protein